MSKKHSHLWSLPPEKVSLPLPPEKVSYPRRSLILRLALLAFFLSLLALYCRPSRPLYSPPNADLDIDTLLLNLPSTANLRNDLKYYTSTAHVAGTEADRQQAEWTRDKFREYGIDRAEVQEYWPYLNYPVSRRLAVVQAPEEGLLFEAGLREDVVEGDETSKMQDAVPTFHGYSANGNVTARLVYANYGAPADFAYLDSLGVNVTGAIILVRYGDYGDIDRGVKVRAAELRGAAGVVIYSDPAEDGCAQKPKYPAGTCRPESSVQRGSVAYDFYPGDPLTPGWAAEKDAPRIDPTEAKVLPRIPSLPISYRDALPLLRALVGTGTNLTDDGWRGALDTEYWTGPSEALVNLVNEVEYKITPVWNVIGRIEGWEEPDKIVIIGNHRDAWVFGAADPNSGSVALLEVVRSFGILLKFGWRPRRTILFASWDAEEVAYFIP
ncbi:hypothetical protein BC936DRAFT_139849 [Jimgerdemannia flammicorona]|uniref:Peptide hydrolase n=1 Tax=Jimgerdemannia flammicorona TaxID=994334 RepID=A0A433B961_9FUNG|nr:hypothetical protein BC936DRAFT_139849 [Jimgerdemannia flammicorona]